MTKKTDQQKITEAEEYGSDHDQKAGLWLESRLQWMRDETLQHTTREMQTIWHMRVMGNRWAQSGIRADRRVRHDEGQVAWNKKES